MVYCLSKRFSDFPISSKHDDCVITGCLKNSGLCICCHFEYFVSLSSVALRVIVDIVPNSPYLKRRQFGRSSCRIPRKPGTSSTSGWLGVELVFAGLVMNELIELFGITQYF